MFGSTASDGCAEKLWLLYADELLRDALLHHDQFDASASKRQAKKIAFFRSVNEPTN